MVAPFGGALDQLTHGQVVAAAGFLLLGLVLGFVLLPLLATPLIALDRWRARLVDPAPLPASPRAPAEAGAWMRDRWLSVRRWRDAGYVVVDLVLDLVVLAVLSLLGTSAGAMLVAPLARLPDDPVNVGPWHADDPPSDPAGLPVVGVLLLSWSPMPGARAPASRSLCCDAPSWAAATALAAELTAVGRSRARLRGQLRQRAPADRARPARRRAAAAGALAMSSGDPARDEEALGADHPAAVGVAAAHEQAKVLMGELASSCAASTRRCSPTSDSSRPSTSSPPRSRFR